MLFRTTALDVGGYVGLHSHQASAGSTSLCLLPIYLLWGGREGSMTYDDVKAIITGSLRFVPAATLSV